MLHPKNHLLLSCYYKNSPLQFQKYVPCYFQYEIPVHLESVGSLFIHNRLNCLFLRREKSTFKMSSDSYEERIINWCCAIATTKIGYQGKVKLPRKSLIWDNLF